MNSAADKTVASMEPSVGLNAALYPATSFQEFVALSKVRMGMLAAIMAGCGAYMASRAELNYMALLHSCVGTFLLGAGAFALNMYLERDLDARMERTRKRPLPAGRMAPVQALTFGVTVVTAGVLYLLVTCNPLTAAIGAIAAGSYVAVYTPMKRISTFNTIVGAIPGALPPVIGWAAASGRIEFGAVLMFAILFLWQLPHFLSLAWMYRDDYKKAGMAMITSYDKDGKFTARQTLIYGVAYVLMTLLPYQANMAGRLYFWTAALSGIFMLGLCLRWLPNRDRKGALHIFLFSLFHLPLIYIMMVADKLS